MAGPDNVLLWISKQMKTETTKCQLTAGKLYWRQGNFPRTGVWKQQQLRSHSLHGLADPDGHFLAGISWSWVPVSFIAPGKEGRSLQTPMNLCCGIY